MSFQATPLLSLMPEAYRFTVRIAAPSLNPLNIIPLHAISY
jgi:hypothetical protein